ncbi:hypothetical protein CLV83_3877 [Marinobacterium mangrovicola]|uniref:Uncharacterized protein n=1 Tax=Marinobacterium mangrovicola TaxID=1476959 RepID=A0A4R1GA73_9GAMM|nr:hypothetical protein CLV83_3877 [Marinobacterium mangrovicola]
MNNASLEFAHKCHAKLNLHPYRTFSDLAHLSRPLLELHMG